MTTHRRICTPVAASIVAGLLVAVAAVGGAMGGGGTAAKADRFATVGDTLCAGQEWPKISNECLAWREGEGVEGAVRYVTVTNTDAADGITTLIRLNGTAVAY